MATAERAAIAVMNFILSGVWWLVVGGWCLGWLFGELSTGEAWGCWSFVVVVACLVVKLLMMERDFW